jgi:hypothetical protein
MGVLNEKRCKNLHEFKLYKYKNEWIKNHEQSNLFLHKNIAWELNMLWNEKVFLVEETINNRYFKTLYYGWCDIGYFRNRPQNIHTKYLTQWPNLVKLLKPPFTNNLIHYANVQNDELIYNNELTLTYIQKHYQENLPQHPNSDLNQNFVAGGFFILNKQMINLYTYIYRAKLEYYFSNNYTIKDDQTILTDIIATNRNLFYIHDILETTLDKWFAFQEILI